MSDRRLMPVDPEVIKQVLVDRILTTVLERYPGDLSGSVEAAVEAPLTPPLSEGGSLDLRMRRIGYLARVTEAEMFDPARSPMDGLLEKLSARLGIDGEWAAVVSELCAELARDEPLPKPRPDDERAISWKVPGPGGHVRHYVVAAAIADALENDGNGGLPFMPGALAEPGELKRPWIYGFLIRCCEEVLPPASEIAGG